MIAVDKTSAQLYLTSTNDPSVEHQLIQVKAEDLTMAYAALCLLSPLTLHFILYWSPGYHLMWILTCGICVLWLLRTNSHGLQKSCGEKGWHCHSLSEREGPNPCLDRLLCPHLLCTGLL